VFPSPIVIFEIAVSHRAESPIVSTDAGIQIDVRDEQPMNADPSIRFNFESGSNEIVERPVQDSKQFSERIFTKAGIQIDCSCEHLENALSLICRN
jgi:hypothetical protein